MLRLLGQGPTFIVLDALDECPDLPGIPSPRYEVLQLVEELFDLHLQGLHICATSRPEVNIRAVLEPWRSARFPYMKKVGKQRTSPTMFKVFCQLDALQLCFPPNLRQFLNELPETLDETYERILRGINKAQMDNAHRLLHCLAVAVRPLRVEELAELLAFDFEASSLGGIPKLKEDWRWDDQEEAVLSTCSSLITIVPNRGSRVVQFSHFSVKEYLTSPRLARSDGDVSRFHVALEAAHTILAQACLGTLLRLDEHVDAKRFPLVEYASRHWVDHARCEKVSSRIQDGIDDLFDTSKPHFAAWPRVHNMDERWDYFSHHQPRGVGSPLYYAAFCGFYDLAERLIMKHPEQVNKGGGHLLVPLPAALHKEHFDVANLLREHGAVVDVRGERERTPLYSASNDGRVYIMRWLLNHGADSNARRDDRWTPLHVAITKHEAIQALLEHNADVNSRTDEGATPLHVVMSYGSRERKRVVQRLLEHGADPHACDHNHFTPLHEASSRGFLEVARVLLSYGANVNEKDGRGVTPFQVASSDGHHEMKKLLLEHGAVTRA
ncbi:ankyrin repeat-containing domain protein [Lactarius pseudohatsudake]|nr:ankyrin repeat-containing domain protein [Lactarius pseudohatsudake]